MISFFSAFFSTIGAWVISTLGRKTIIVSLSISAYVTATAAFLVCINLLVGSVLSFAITPTWITAGVGMFLPYSFTANLSVIVGALACRFAYDILIDKIKLIGNAN